mgnify:CR=1 FL=1
MHGGEAVLRTRAQSNDVELCDWPRDRFAEDQIKEMEDEEKRDEEMSDRALGIDRNAPKSQNEADHIKRKEALKQAKRDWEARKMTEDAAKKTISGEEDRDYELNQEVLSKKPVLIISDNTNCTYRIPPHLPIVKVFVENCKGCTLVIACKLLTQHLEAFNCEECTFRFEAEMQIVQLDQCPTKITLNYAREALMGQVCHSAGVVLGRTSC